jgi:hypothetical protein
MLASHGHSDPRSLLYPALRILVAVVHTVAHAAKQQFQHEPRGGCISDHRAHTPTSLEDQLDANVMHLSKSTA